MNLDEEKIKEFEAIINRFSKFIKANILKFDLHKNGIDPEDVNQEIKIKIWKILNNEKEIRNYSSYIKKIVDTSVIDQIRKSRRQEGIINHEKQKKISEQKSYYLKENPHDKNLSEIIEKALGSLLISRRKVVRLFLLNMNVEEIAVLLNWSKDKTRNLLYRGLYDLKKKLKENGIEYENK